MSDITCILSQIESGDPSAANKLLPLVYDELRKLAAAKMAQEKPGQTRMLIDQADSLAEDPDLILSLDELLARLGVEDTAAAQVAQLHLFGGLSVAEAGQVLGSPGPWPIGTGSMPALGAGRVW